MSLPARIDHWLLRRHRRVVLKAQPLQMPSKPGAPPTTCGCWQFQALHDPQQPPASKNPLFTHPNQVGDTP